MTLTPEQRTAQRKIVGLLNRRSGMWFEQDAGLCIWRDKRASEEWGLGIPELSEYFDTLEIPYSVRVELLTIGKQRKAGFTAVISWDHLDTLTTWAPSFQPQIDNAKADMAEDPTTAS